MSSVFSSILGQEPAVQTLRRAIQRNKLHHAYRFEGPSGVGKELTALALGQSLVCRVSREEGCGECAACRRVTHFSKDAPCVPQHPDVVFVARGLYPPPLVTARETTGIGVEQIRKVVLPRVGYGPHEGRGLLIVIRDAEDLTTAAANALLKTLEEPHSGVHFVLLTSAPNRLLDTIRSRTQALRFGALSEGNLRAILTAHGKDPEAAQFADGSAQMALEVADAERLAANRQVVERFNQAIRAPSIEAGLELASELPKDRDQVARVLQAYTLAVAVEVRALAQEAPDRAARIANRFGIVRHAIESLARNAAPQAVVEAMFVELRQHAR